MTELRLTSLRSLGHWGRTLVVFALVVTLGASTAGSAAAGGGTVKAFQQWGDSRDYHLLDGGNLEGVLGPLLLGARRVGENEPWKAFGADDRTAVELRPGSVMVLRSVESYFADIRFFLKKPGRSDSRLVVRIEAIGWDVGVVQYVINGTGKGWAPSNPLVMPVPEGPQLVGLVVVTITAVGPGTWRVDDLSIDPWRND